MHGGDGATTAGDGGEGAAELPRSRAHLTAATTADAVVRLDTRGGDATEHGRGRERGQTKEKD